MKKSILLLFLIGIAGVAGAATTAVVVDLDQASFGNEGPDRQPDVDDSTTTMSEITYDFSAVNSLFTEPGSNAVPIYGGYRAIGAGLISSDSYIKLSSAGKIDTRAVKLAGVTGTSMATTLLFWDAADFLTDNYNTFGNTSGSRIAIDAKIVNPKGVNAILRDGDTYYLSEGGITASGTLVVSGVDARWAPIDPADFTLFDPENTTTFGLTTNAFESRFFTNVTGVGLIGKVDRGSGNPAIIEINDMMVSLQKNGEGPVPVSPDSPFPEDSWGVYSWTKFTQVDKNSAPLIKGGPLITRWIDIEPQDGVYEFETEIEDKLQKALDNDWYTFINIWVAGPSESGWTPEWLYAKGIPKVSCERGNFPYYFHNYVPGQPPEEDSYQYYYFRLLNAIADHILSLPQELRERVAFIQCAEGSTGDGYCYKGDVLSGYEQYEISREDWNVFRLDAWKEFKAAYSVDGQLQIPLLTNDDANNVELRQWMLEELDAIGVKQGMFSHGYQISDAQERLREHFEFKEQAEAAGKEFFARGEMDGEMNEFGWITQNQAQGLYWSAIYATHCGLNHWNVPQDAVKLSKYNDAFNFFNTHAGQFNPAAAGNAFCAFYRGLDASDTQEFPEGTGVGKYGTATKNNQQRYIDICNAYSAYGAGMADPYAATGGGMRNRSATGYNDAGWQILKENFQRHITQIDAEETSSAWWQIDDSIYGRFARGFEPAANKNAMYFDVDDLYFEANGAQNDGNLSVRIVYYAEDGGSWSLKYHAQDGTMKTAQTVNNAGPGSGWQHITIDLTDALLDNGGERGADLILESDGQTDCRFHLIELTRTVPDPPVGYGAFALQYSLQEGPEGDDDDDGLSNLGEYALNGNPTNENDVGLVEMQVDGSLFTFVHASNVVDSSLIYRQLDRTNLVFGITHTNHWDSQTISLPDGDYATVSNHYAVGEQEQRFIQLHVEQE